MWVVRAGREARRVGSTTLISLHCISGVSAGLFLGGHTNGILFSGPACWRCDQIYCCAERVLIELREKTRAVAAPNQKLEYNSGGRPIVLAKKNVPGGSRRLAEGAVDLLRSPRKPPHIIQHTQNTTLAARSIWQNCFPPIVCFRYWHKLITRAVAKRCLTSFAEIVNRSRSEPGASSRPSHISSPRSTLPVTAMLIPRLRAGWGGA